MSIIGNQIGNILFEHSSDIVVIFSQDDLILRKVNQRFEDILGYTRSEVINRSLNNLGIIPAKGPSVHIPLYSLLAKGDILKLELPLRTKTGHIIHVLFSAFNLRYGYEDCWLAIMNDISVNKFYEQELTRLDRLNLIGEMAATVGHEVRNPMTTVRGFLQMLQMRDPESENCLYYNLMIEELDRANAIITEFLGVASGKKTDLKPQCLARLITSLLPMIHSQAISRDMNLQTDIPDPLPPSLMLNESEIRQMILNLAYNGLEAMSAGGTLTIGLRQDNTEVVLLIRDEGSGIASEHLDKIGTPFYTTKEKGTGLGLSVCHTIAKQHGARIGVKTAPGCTTFSIHFPIPSLR
ncbi:MAG: PAS domain S-box protein [Syntrophomonadaceae bacterium]|nr:PAS domain S-box protein [Syntrophomonadaceae bacterium]